MAVLLGGHNLTPLEEIESTDLLKIWGFHGTPVTPGYNTPATIYILYSFLHQWSKNESGSQWILVRLHTWTFVKQSSCMYCHHSGRHKTVKCVIYFADYSVLALFLSKVWYDTGKNIIFHEIPLNLMGLVIKGVSVYELHVSFVDK